MRDLPRQKALGTMAAVTIPPTAVVGAAPSVMTNPGLDRLNGLIQSRIEMRAQNDAAWEVVSDIDDGDAMSAAPRVRVETHYILMGKDDNGADIREPRYAYDEHGIRKAIEPHRQARLAMCGTTHPQSAALRERVNANIDASIDKKVAELSALRAERERIESAIGYTAARAKALETSDKLRAIEVEIASHRPQTLDEVAVVSKWILDTCADDDLQSDEDEIRISILKSFAAIGSVDHA